MVSRCGLVLGAVFAALSASIGPSFAAPQPNPVPTRWEFEFEPGPLRLTVVETEEGPQPFLYLTYRVANYTDRDRIFAPSFEMMTDEGTLRRSGRDVPRSVTRAIIDRLENPLLEDQLSIVDTLRRGRENAKFGVVVWPVEDFQIDEATVFAAGFSGESTSYFTTDPETGQRTRHLLRKTRVLRYDLPGQIEPQRRDTPFDVIERAWEMR